MKLDLGKKGLWILTGFGKVSGSGSMKVQVVFGMLNLSYNGFRLTYKGQEISTLKPWHIGKENIQIAVELELLPIFNFGDVWSGTEGQKVFHFTEVLERHSIALHHFKILSENDQEQCQRSSKIREEDIYKWKASQYRKYHFWEMLQDSEAHGSPSLFAIPRVSLFKRFLYLSSNLTRLFSYSGVSISDTYQSYKTDFDEGTITVTKKKSLIPISDSDYKTIATIIGNDSLNTAINKIKSYFRIIQNESGSGYLNPVISISDFLNTSMMVELYGMTINRTSIRGNPMDDIFRVYSLGEVSGYPWFRKLILIEDREKDTRSSKSTPIDSPNESSIKTDLEISNDITSANNAPIQKLIGLPYNPYDRLKMTKEYRSREDSFDNEKKYPIGQFQVDGITTSVSNLSGEDGDQTALVNVSLVYFGRESVSISLSSWLLLIHRNILNKNERGISIGPERIPVPENSIKGITLFGRIIVVSWIISSTKVSYYYFEIHDTSKGVKHRSVLVSGVKTKLDFEFYKNILIYSTSLGGFEKVSIDPDSKMSHKAEYKGTHIKIKRFNLKPISRGVSEADQSAKELISKVFNYIL